MKGVVKVVVVGTGSIGSRHLRLLQAMGVAVVAMPTRPERYHELTEQGVTTLARWEDAPTAGITHAVIATDTHRHQADIRSAMAAGCHVLSEKPLTVDAQSAKSTLASATSLGRELWVGCVLRFQDALCQFRDWLPQLGSLHNVRIECQTYLPEWRPERDYRTTYSAHKDEGGVLRDLVHEIDYAGWLYGWPTELFARVSNFGRLGIEAEETAELTWRLMDGPHVSLSLDYLSRPARRHMTAYGEHGTLAWDGIAKTVKLALAGKADQWHQSAAAADTMYSAQLQAFVYGESSQLASGVEGMRSLAICDAARLASLRRTETQVSYL